jgi:CRISPR-associated protein Cmr4
LTRKLALLGVTGTTGMVPALGTSGAVGTTGWVGQQVFGPFVSRVDDAHPRTATLGAMLGALAVPDGMGFDYTRTKLATDVVTTADTTLASVSTMGTDVVARVQLKPDKTVANLFYSEHLPAETVLAAVLAGSDEGQLDALAGFLNGQPIQLGGDETIGKGVLWCRVVDTAAVREALETGPAEAEAQAGAGTSAVPPSGGAPAAPKRTGAPSPASMPSRTRS